MAQRDLLAPAKSKYYSFLGPLFEERGGCQNRPRLYADVVGNPRDDSHIKVKGMLFGKLKLNP